MNFPQRFSIIYLVYTFAIIFAASAADLRHFPFTSFSEKTDQNIFHFGSPYSSIDHGALQLTPDSENADVSYFNKSGRIMFHKAYRLWPSDNEDDDEVASFNSTFLMNIYREKEWTAGEGFAFLIASDWRIPENSYGQWLGLTNATTNGNSTNYMVAIEFDTKKQDFDPDDNHIGLNVNSVISSKTVSLEPYGIEISPEVGTNYTVWVQYNGSSKVLEVYMAKRNMTPAVRPETPVMRETINLKQYLKQDSYFGFSGSTGSPAKQLNCVLEWNLEVQEFKTKKSKILLKVGVPALVLSVLFGVILGVVYVKKKKRTNSDESLVLGTLKRLPGMPREFRYKELKDATKSFHPSMILGQGGFGIVYRGTLRDFDDANGTNKPAEIAVKQFSRDNIKGKDDFMAELTIIHRLRHKNLVRLVGWCYEKGKLLLVYDFMPNGSVDGHLYEASDQNTLNWKHRCKILAGVASALHYLQNEYDQKVVHRDLKASNILLDSEFNARLGDFGLARALEQERNSYAELELAGVAGTLGYVAPECFHTRKATPESDVFGFGAVVLEIVCGKHPGIQIMRNQRQFSLVDWVWMLHREGCIEEAVDERLQSNYSLDEAKKLLLLGLACSHPIASERPQTQAICQIISGTMSVPNVPPFKPVFTWSSMGTTFSSTDSTVSSITLSRNTLSLP